MDWCRQEGIFRWVCPIGTHPSFPGGPEPFRIVGVRLAFRIGSGQCYVSTRFCCRFNRDFESFQFRIGISGASRGSQYQLGKIIAQRAATQLRFRIARGTIEPAKIQKQRRLRPLLGETNPPQPSPNAREERGANPRDRGSASRSCPCSRPKSRHKTSTCTESIPSAARRVLAT